MPTILNDSETESDSDSELDCSIESNESDDRADRSTGSDNYSDAKKLDVVDDVTISTI